MKAKVRVEKLRLLFVALLLLVAGSLMGAGAASASPVQGDNTASIAASGCSSWTVQGDGWESFASCHGRPGKVRAEARCADGTRVWDAYGIWESAMWGRKSAALCDRMQRPYVARYSYRYVAS